MELPVITTNIRGCREVVKQNETGIVVPLKDRQAFIAAVETLAQDENRRIRFGKAGRQHMVSCFDHQFVLEKLCNLYFQIQVTLQRPATDGNAILNFDLSNGIRTRPLQ